MQGGPAQQGGRQGDCAIEKRREAQRGGTVGWSPEVTPDMAQLAHRLCAESPRPLQPVAAWGWSTQTALKRVWNLGGGVNLPPPEQPLEVGPTPPPPAPQRFMRRNRYSPPPPQPPTQGCRLMSPEQAWDSLSDGGEDASSLGPQAPCWEMRSEAPDLKDRESVFKRTQHPRTDSLGTHLQNFPEKQHPAWLCLSAIHMCSDIHVCVPPHTHTHRPCPLAWSTLAPHSQGLLGWETAGSHLLPLTPAWCPTKQGLTCSREHCGRNEGESIRPQGTGLPTQVVSPGTSPTGPERCKGTLPH